VLLLTWIVSFIVRCDCRVTAESVFRFLPLKVLEVLAARGRGSNLHLPDEV